VAADTPFVDAAHEIRRPLGQVLVDQGLITAEQLEQALAVQSDSEKQLGEVLVMLGFISPGVVANGLAEQHGGPLKTEYGISAGFGGERQEAKAAPAPEPREPAPQEETPDVLAPWRTAVEQRDAVIAQFRGEAAQRSAQVDALSEQLATGARRIAELEAQLQGQEGGGESHSAELAAREEQLTAALARVEQAAAAARAAAEAREALEARVQEVERERDAYLSSVEELKATAAAQAEALASREAESGNLAELESLLENVSGVLHARVAELEGERSRLAAQGSKLEAERDDLRARLAEATAAPAPAPAAPAPVGRTYDESSHLFFVPSPAGYLIVERTGAAPREGETVELDGRALVVTRVGPSPLGTYSVACAYLAET
jgi:hypothetical protein